MVQFRFRSAAALLAAICLLPATGCTPSASNPAEQTLQLVRDWVRGAYNNVAQFEADMAAEVPAEQMHRPMHQLFADVSAPQLDGYIVYQQSSLDGSEAPAMIFRHGLLQYIPDPNSDALIQRELYFKDPGAFKNLHRNPELLAPVVIDDLTWDAGCDFYLSTNAAGDMVSGPIKAGACVLFNEGLNKNMYADDRLEITATDYRFKGVYVDEDGAALWGTASDELNSLTRQ